MRDKGGHEGGGWSGGDGVERRGLGHKTVIGNESLSYKGYIL